MAAWVTVTSSRMPRAPKMIAGQEQAADVDVAQARRLQVADVLRAVERGEPGQLVEHDREDGHQRQRGERPDHRGHGPGVRALGQQEA